MNTSEAIDLQTLFEVLKGLNYCDSKDFSFITRVAGLFNEEKLLSFDDVKVILLGIEDVYSSKLMNNKKLNAFSILPN